jgi:hypothetical protein
MGLHVSVIMAYCARMPDASARARYDEATAGPGPPLAIVDLAASGHNAAGLVRPAGPCGAHLPRAAPVLRVTDGTR